MVFAYFFGMCSYIAVSKNVKTALGLGAAVTFVMFITVPLNYLIDEFLLQPGALAWISPKLGRCGFEFPFVHCLHRCYRFIRAARRDGRGEVQPFAV